MYQRITFNLVGAQKRYETLNGKQRLVVPAVMLVEGVHAGSGGPYFYPKEELGKNPQTCNHRPVVLYHPSMEDGSACQPSVLEAQGVGDVYNSAYDGRLKTEAWLDEDKLRRLDSRVTDAIDAGKMVEVSTGIFHDLDKKEGDWNGEKYIGIVRNIQLDHLAILPDQKGSCSIADGGGLLRNAATAIETGPSLDDIRSQIQKLLRDDRTSGTKAFCEDYCYVCDIYSKFAVYDSNDKSYKVGYKLKAGKVVLDGEPEEVRKVTSYVTANGEQGQVQDSKLGRVYLTMNGQIIGNEEHQGPLKLPKPSAAELSDPMRKQQMQKTLEAKYSGIQQEGDWGGWVTDLFANYVVWSKDGKLFRLPYTYDDDKINFDGEPEEVERVSEYRTRRDTPIDGTQSPYNVNKGAEMPNQPITQKQLDAIVQCADFIKSKKVTANAIHQGAHELIHSALGHTDAHAEPAKSDSQARSTAGGARSDEVGRMISGGHAKEEDRKFLEGLPDDHFASVSKYVMRGATTVVQPYTYEGIGDRSNAHTANQNKEPSLNQYIQGAPEALRGPLLNMVAAHEREKEGLVKTITANSRNSFNPEWLAKQDIGMLRGLASLAGPAGSGTPTANYAGQGEVPMFIQNQQTTNADTDPVPTLAMPDMWAKPQAG